MRRTTGILLGPVNDEMRAREAERRRELVVSRECVPPVSRKPPAKLSFWEILTKHGTLYLKHTCLAGVKYREFKRASKLRRFLWVCGRVYICYLAMVLVYAVYQDYLESPISVWQKDENFDGVKLQFPGIAICPINKISRRVGMELATKMFDAKISNLTVSEIYNAIASLGDLYLSQIMPENDYSPIIELLSKFYNDNYDINDILEMLTPQCSAMFLICHFNNERKNCTDIFRLSKTRDGFCCTFNYIVAKEDETKSESERDATQIFFTKSTGKNSGLTVWVDPLLEDYGYSNIPTIGWTMMVFNPYDYPDQNCGRVSLHIVPPLTRVYTEIFATYLIPNAVVRSYPIEKRGCVFGDERKEFHGMYSFSKCIAQCRVEDIWNSCKCRPFFYPRFGQPESVRRTCDVRDIKCLGEYSDKKQTVIPHKDQTVMSAISDEETALMCDNCYPECQESSYLALNSKVNLKSGYYSTKESFGVNVTSQSLLQVYLSDKVHTILKQDESCRWYEYLSDIGGIFSFFLGISIVAIVELIYFLAQFLLEVFGFITLKMRKKNSDKIVARSVYWNEYFPRPRIDTRIYRGVNARF